MTQHMDALTLANERRCEGARFRRGLATLPMDEGCEMVAELLLDPDVSAHIAAMPVRRCLTAIHRLGESKVGAIMREGLMLRPNPKIRDLTARERRALARVLHERAARYRPVKAA